MNSKVLKSKEVNGDPIRRVRMFIELLLIGKLIPQTKWLRTLTRIRKQSWMTLFKSDQLLQKWKSSNQKFSSYLQNSRRIRALVEALLNRVQIRNCITTPFRLDSTRSRTRPLFMFPLRVKHNSRSSRAFSRKNLLRKAASWIRYPKAQDHAVRNSPNRKNIILHLNHNQFQHHGTDQQWEFPKINHNIIKTSSSRIMLKWLKLKKRSRS